MNNQTSRHASLSRIASRWKGEGGGGGEGGGLGEVTDDISDHVEHKNNHVKR